MADRRSLYTEAQHLVNWAVLVGYYFTYCQIRLLFAALFQVSVKTSLL